MRELALVNIASLGAHFVNKAWREAHEWWPVIVGLVMLTLIFRRHWRIIVSLFLPLFAMDTVYSIYQHVFHEPITVNPEFVPVVAMGLSLILLVLWVHPRRVAQARVALTPPSPSKQISVATPPTRHSSGED